jgi:glutamyl-tRNA reductase
VTDASRDTPFALGVHARDVDSAAREAFADRVRELRPPGLLIETCHRIEWYGADAEAAAAVAEVLPAGGRRFAGAGAARHAIETAVGLDSVVVGEDQVLHQVRSAVGEARAARTLAPDLDQLFAIALRAGRRARSWRQQHQPSLADAAVAVAETHVGPLHGRGVLVVGAGEMGRLAAIAASAAGARVAIVNRTAQRAAAVARLVGGRLTPPTELPEIGVTAVIVAVRGGWPLSAAVTGQLATGKPVVVDLSAPSVVPPAMRRALGSRFVGVDDLARGPAATLEPRLVARLRGLVDGSLAEFLVWTETQGRRDAARALAERAEREREAALAELWRRLPGLEPASRAAVERMSRHLAERLLRDPLERLGDDRDGSHERAVRELWAL